MTARGPETRREQSVRENTIRFKRDIAHAAGGLLPLRKLMQALDLKEAGDVALAIQDRRLLALLDGDETLFPACQIQDGALLEGLKPILDAAPSTSGWRILQYLLYSEDGLAGRRPIDLIQGSPEDLEVAIRFARRLEE